MFSLAGARFTDPALRVARGRFGGARTSLGLTTCVVVLLAFFPALPAGAEEIRWLAPVDAPVVDEFRPPSNRFGAGNRGLEYGLDDPVDIRAVDDGRVTFAGRVGPTLFVTIEHGNGLKSTLAYLDSVNVVRGQFVRIGDIVASAGNGFHLTARLDGVYIDPAALIAGVEIGVALVAGPAAAGGAAQPQRRVGQPQIGRGFFDPLRTVVHSGIELSPTSLLVSTAEAVHAWHHRDCSDVAGSSARSSTGQIIDLRPVDNGDRVLIQVGGLGSHSEGASIGKLDPLSLGYDAADVKAFSYASGCIAVPFGFDGVGLELDGHEPNPYAPEDTYQDINVSAGHLADLVEMAADQRPGAVIDVAAHSLGGVVTRRAVEILAERNRSDVLGVVMTVGSPHQGADLATIASAAHGGLDLVDQASAEIAHFRDADSVIQLSEVGGSSIGPAPIPPDGPTVVAIAGASDPIVPASAAIWDGATNVLVNPGDPREAHSVLPGAPEVHDALALAIAGAAPACTGLATTLGGAAVGAGVTAAENAATIAAGVAHWLL